MALYRTYRPQIFADVVGQDHIVTTLEQAVAQDKLSHAYLFAGSRGTGKTSVARILAKHLLTRGITDPVLKQQIIKGVEDGTIVDLLEIDAASQRRIDDARDLIEKIQFSPVVASAKVYIIDEVHMLTKEAFNALLKTLEEPPAYAHFILATTELHKIPATIQSRCQCFPFRAIREDDIVRRLQFIADQEHIVVDREALRLIARHVEGGLRDAISLLDQMRSLVKITPKDVESRIGSSGHEHIEAVAKALAEKDTSSLIDAVRRLEEAGVPLDLFLRQLLGLAREHLHKALEEKEPIKDILRVLDTLLAAVRDVRFAPVPGLVVESALLSLCQPSEEKGTRKADPFGLESKGKEKTLKREKTGEPAKTEAPVAQTAVGPVPASSLASAEFQAPEVSLENIRSSWTHILEGTSPASVKMSLKNGEVQNLEGTKVIVSFSSTFHRDKVSATEASRTIEEVMQKIFKRSLKLECILEKNHEKSEGAKENVVNLAEAAAEIF
ncbi:MAG: DNA polymerase III subunit gamma/tau [Candidatus Peribacteraceae bacterium]|nr:DNA polymerase III subunit gamma/tau [Candidatus Peribacteraceae bacterium]MDD5074864.1 DNA polymerase III subunit gamma/tau [Candidatus Peribacteraceae bacterium]